MSLAMTTKSIGIDADAVAFGLSDRYTWLQEDFPREDGAARRPLPHDEDLQPKPALRTLRRELASARHRHPLWRSRRR
jgi:endo-1,4-beta-xylanase